MGYRSSIEYLPLRFSLRFLIFTELLVWFGPIKYDIPNSPLLILYLLILNLSLYLGYRSGVRNFSPSKISLSIPLIQVVCVLGAFHVVLELIHMWTSHGLSISLSTIVNAIFNPGEAYHSSTMVNVESPALLTLLSPFGAAVLPLGIFYWKKIPKSFRALIAFVILVELVSWLGIGTRKGILDVFLIIVFLALAANHQCITNKRSYRKIKIAITLAVIVFVFYFVYSNVSRGGYELKDILYVDINSDIRSFYTQYCPFWLCIVLVSITSYLCQGYYALGLGLDLGILPLAPLGMSWFTMLIASMFGYDPMPSTYMAHLVEYGIDPKINWHTIYLWLANDVSFIGVPFLIYFIGKLFSITWCDTVAGKNYLAPITFSLMLIMVFYFFANNQVLSFSFIPFVLFLSIYLMTRIKI